MAHAIWELLLPFLLPLFQIYAFMLASLGIADQIVSIKALKYKIVRQLGEGGYSFVYLAREAMKGQSERQQGSHGMEYAIKKVGREALRCSVHLAESHAHAPHAQLKAGTEGLRPISPISPSLWPCNRYWLLAWSS